MFLKLLDEEAISLPGRFKIQMRDVIAPFCHGCQPLSPSHSGELATGSSILNYLLARSQEW